MWATIVALWKKTTLEHKVIAALAIMAVAGIVAWRIEAVLTAQAKYDATVASNNAKAALDVTHHYHVKTDSMHVVVNRLQLEKKVSDSALKAAGVALATVSHDLKLTQKALTDVTLAFADYTQHTTAPQVATDSGRISTDTLHGPSIVGTANVFMPVDSTKPARWWYDLRIPPFKAIATIGCTPDHEATATWQTPSWVTATIGLGEVDPTTCMGQRPSLFSLGFLKLTPTETFIAGGIGGALLYVGVKSLFSHGK